MKKLFYVGLLILTSSLTVLAANQKLKVPRLKSVGGAFGHPVLMQTAPELVQKKGGIVVLRKFYIARWGVHRYEYGMAQYQCRSSQCEMLGDPVALKYYKQCTGITKNGKPKCTNLESARVDITDPSGNGSQSSDKRTWYSCEDYGSPCADRDDLNEYPSRYSADDQDLPTGI